MIDSDMYGEKINRLEKIYAGKEIDEGGHWKKQPLSPGIDEFVAQLQNRFGLTPRILDQGSGTGGHTIELAIGYKLDVMGVERTWNGVKNARLLASREELLGKGVNFVRGDMLALPIRDGVFEGFHDFCSLSHLHYKDWNKYFAEAARVTVPGALGMIVDFYGGDDEFYGVPIREENIGWLEFRDGEVHLQNRDERNYSRLHKYPDKYENMSWYFANMDELEEASRGYFRVLDMYPWDHPEPKSGQVGKRYYLNALLERI